MAIRTSCGTANIKFQFRRGTAAQWSATNPVLAIGEPGFEIDTNGLKIGDGTTPWNFEGYAGNPAFVSVKDFGARGDGLSKPLSGYFASLAIAQTYFPAATSLTDELDWAAFSKAIQSNRTIFVPAGTYQFGANSLFIQGSNIKIHGTGQTSLITTSILPNNSLSGMIQLGNCTNIVFEDIGFSSTAVYGSQTVDNYYGLVWSSNKNLMQIIFQRCYFTAPTANTNGIKIINESTQIAENIECVDCIFQNLGRMGVEFQNHNDASPLARYRSFKADKCVFKNIGLIANGMGVSLSGIGENCIISNNIFDNCRIGLELVGPNDTTVISNKFLNFPLANSNFYDYFSNSGRPFSFTGSRVMSGTRVIGNITETAIAGSTYFWGQRDMVLSNNKLNHTRQSWNSTQTYVAGETILYTVTNQYYVCLQTNVNKPPNTEPTFWTNTIWSSTTTYSSGQGTVYNGILYRSNIEGNLNNIPPTNWSVSSIPVTVDFRNVQGTRATNEKYTTNTGGVVVISDTWTETTGSSIDNQFVNCTFDNTNASVSGTLFNCTANTNTTNDTNLIGCFLNKASGGTLFASSQSGTGVASPPVLYLAKHNTNVTLRGDLTFGNTIRVDPVWGDDTIANLTASNSYTYPFRTINNAISALTSGKTMVLLPGTYTLTSGITLPANTCLRGANVQTTTIQMLNVSASTTLITMQDNCRLEDITLNLSGQSGANLNLTGILFPDATPYTAKLRVAVVNVETTESTGGNIYGIQATGNTADTSVYSSSNAIRGSTINVNVSGTCTAYGIYVNGRTRFTSRDTNIVSRQKSVGTSSGNRVGVVSEYYNSMSDTAFVELKQCSAFGSTYDINRIAGVIQLSSTDLINASANGNGFSVNTEPSHLSLSLFDKNNPLNTGTYYILPGTQLQANASTLPLGIPFSQRIVMFEALATSPGKTSGNIVIDFFKTDSTFTLGTPFATLTLNGTTNQYMWANSSTSFDGMNDYFVVRVTLSESINSKNIFISVSLY